MKFVFDTNYSKEKLGFLESLDCEILAEIKLSKTNFSQYEIPRRMFRYGGTYIAEIIDDETDELVWAVLSKRNGIYHFSACGDSLETIIQGL